MTGWLCLAENMPSGTAQRPSDVITIRGGKTVEVLNTDAEGRLVMADGLVAAIEENPDVVLDIATLTGAQMVALGTRVSAVMGTDDVRGEVLAAAESAGEQFWPMPLPEELLGRHEVQGRGHREHRRPRSAACSSPASSCRSSSAPRRGPTWTSRARRSTRARAHGYTPVGGTGVGVRTLLELLEGRAAK